MTRMALTRISLFLLFASISLGARADVLLIQQVRQAGAMNLPVNGMSMNEVEAAFGAPEQKLAAVGDPPITKWRYARWSVYFEYDRALYTVLHQGEVIDSANEASDAPGDTSAKRDDAGDNADDDAGDGAGD